LALTSSKLREAADELEPLEQQEEEIKERFELKGWLNNQPLSDEYEISTNMAKAFNMNLTQVKKELEEFPEDCSCEEQNIPKLVKELRTYRRKVKGKNKFKMTKGIENLINSYSSHLDDCIKSIYWLSKYEYPLKQMKFSEFDLKKIHSIKDYDTRSKIVDALCKYWEADLNIKNVSYSKDYAALSKQMKEGKKEFNKLVEEGGKKELEAAIKGLKAQKARLAAQRRGTGFKEERLDILNEEIAKLEEALETVIKTNKALKDQENQTKKNEEATQKLKEAMTAVGEEIETSIKGNLRDAITGAQSFGQAMTNVLNKIRDKIIDAQIDKLLGQFGERFGSAASGGQRKGIGGFLGGLLGGLFRENGGPVKAGQPYIVGERQPELFVPRTSGTILPSVPTGGGGTTNNMITVNVDATGSSVAGSGSGADQLGQLIGGIVQQTLVREQRAGGLLNR